MKYLYFAASFLCSLVSLDAFCKHQYCCAMVLKQRLLVKWCDPFPFPIASPPPRWTPQTSLWTGVWALLRAFKQVRKPAWRFASSPISLGRWKVSWPSPRDSAASTSSPYTGSATPRKPRARSTSGPAAKSTSPSRTSSCRPPPSLSRWDRFTNQPTPRTLVVLELPLLSNSGHWWVFMVVTLIGSHVSGAYFKWIEFNSTHLKSIAVIFQLNSFQSQSIQFNLIQFKSFQVSSILYISIISCSITNPLTEFSLILFNWI